MSMPPAILLLLGLYFLALIAFSLIRTPQLSGKAIFLFRAFFPSWKFFEDAGHVPQLFFRVAGPGAELGPWTPGLETPGRTPGMILFNPRGAYLLAAGSLLQQLVSDLDEADEANPEALEHSVTYQLTRRLVLQQLAKAPGGPAGLRYQFKVSASEPGFPGTPPEDILLSPVYEA